MHGGDGVLSDGAVVMMYSDDDVLSGVVMAA